MTTLTEHDQAEQDRFDDFGMGLGIIAERVVKGLGIVIVGLLIGCAVVNLWG